MDDKTAGLELSRQQAELLLDALMFYKLRTSSAELVLRIEELEDETVCVLSLLECAETNAR